MDGIFIDTSAYYALIDTKSTDNSLAREAMAHVADSGATLFTTNYTIAELHALVLSRFYPDMALRAIDSIERSTTTTVRANIHDEQRAREIIRKYKDKGFSLVDAI